VFLHNAWCQHAVVGKSRGPLLTEPTVGQGNASGKHHLHKHHAPSPPPQNHEGLVPGPEAPGASSTPPPPGSPYVCFQPVEGATVTLNDDAISDKFISGTASTGRTNTDCAHNHCPLRPIVVRPHQSTLCSKALDDTGTDTVNG